MLQFDGKKGALLLIFLIAKYIYLKFHSAGPSGRAVYGVGLRLLAY